MYIKINDYKVINANLIQEVCIQDRNVYARINGMTYSLYTGESQQQAIQFLKTFMEHIKAEQSDINSIIESTFKPEVKTIAKKKINKAQQSEFGKRALKE